MFMCETLGAVTDASSCPRSAQRFGRRVAGQIYVCGWKAGALCWGRGLFSDTPEVNTVARGTGLGSAFHWVSQ